MEIAFPVGILSTGKFATMQAGAAPLSHDEQTVLGDLRLVSALSSFPIPLCNKEFFESTAWVRPRRNAGVWFSKALEICGDLEAFFGYVEPRPHLMVRLSFRLTDLPYDNVKTQSAFVWNQACLRRSVSSDRGKDISRRTRHGSNGA